MTDKETTSFSKGVVSGLQWMYLSSMLQGATRLLVLVFMTRLLDPEHFGIMGIALIFASFAERIGQVGIGPALVQKENLSDLEIRAGVFLSFVCGLVIFVSLACAAPFVADFFRSPPVASVLQILALTFIIDGLVVVTDSMLQRRLEFQKLMVAENASYVLGNACVGVVLAWLGWGVWALVFATLTNRLVRAVILLGYKMQPWFCLYCTRREAARLLSPGMGYSLARVLSFVSLQGDNFVVGRVLGVDLLGMYTRGYALMTLPATYLGQVLERVLFPAMAQKQGDLTRLKKVFFGNIELVTLVSLPMSIFMYFFATEIVTVLFGVRWSTLIPVLEILSFGVFFRTAYKCGDTLARSMGAPYKLALRQLVYIAAIVFGAWIGATLGGLQGVAFAVVLAVAVNYLLMAQLSCAFLKISVLEFLKAHRSGVWVATLMTIALLGVVPILHALSGNSFVVLPLGIIATGIIFVLALIVAPRSCRPSIMASASAHLPMKRLGRFGGFIQWVLGVRQVPSLDPGSHSV